MCRNNSLEPTIKHVNRTCLLTRLGNWDMKWSAHLFLYSRFVRKLLHFSHNRNSCCFETWLNIGADGKNNKTIHIRIEYFSFDQIIIHLHLKLMINFHKLDHFTYFDLFSFFSYVTIPFIDISNWFDIMQHGLFAMQLR